LQARRTLKAFHDRRHPRRSHALPPSMVTATTASAATELGIADTP
jgi:hypothetical protein